MTTSNQCDYRYAHNLTTDTPMGPRCDAKATHRIDWGDGRHSFGCDAHLQIDSAATVKPVAIEKLDVKMTYAELKAKLEELTPEQLQQHVEWCGDERGGFVRHVWIADEDWIGESSDHETWLPRSEALHNDAEAYADADICIPRGTVSLIVDGGVAPRRRFFKMGNHGTGYWFVAADIDHCRTLLMQHGAVLYTQDGEEVQLEPNRPDLFDRTLVTWSEITFEQALLKMTSCDDYERESPAYRAPLAHRRTGTWFCSEY